jgi:hypothetical protein
MNIEKIENSESFQKKMINRILHAVYLLKKCKIRFVFEFV